ncbi:MAG: response regulator transcription factor [Anaerolineales bacterium]|jgi:CheY-like chemotaxis protein
MTKILIAEDERDIRELISFTLEYEGYDVIVTANGEDALEMVYKERPDLVLLDVRMPRMDGYEVCRRIVNDVTIQHIPVAFISAKGQQSEIDEGMGAGAVDYLLKPFSRDQLLGMVVRLLSEK